jgi:archaellum component FlaC
MLTQVQLIIEIILSFFLFLGIIYSFYLSRVLSHLKRDRASLLSLVEKLQSSVTSAEEGVEKLRVAGEVSGRPLSRMIEQAKASGSELDSMASKADSVADRLQEVLTRVPNQERRLERLLLEVEDAQEELAKDLATLQSYNLHPTPEVHQISEETPPPASIDSTEHGLSDSWIAPEAEAPTAPQLTASTNPPAPPPAKRSKFADHVEAPPPGSLTRARPYLKALNRTFLKEP